VPKYEAKNRSKCKQVKEQSALCRLLGSLQSATPTVKPFFQVLKKSTLFEHTFRKSTQGVFSNVYANYIVDCNYLANFKEVRRYL
jgi:hypothetical protein